MRNAIYFDTLYTLIVIPASYSLDRFSLLRFCLIGSPPTILALHLDQKKNTKHTSVPLHNLQILEVTIYNRY